MKLDFVWLVDDRPVIVADAKYKAERPSGFPNADLYQMLAYCTVLGLDAGHLIYAEGNEDAQVHMVRMAGIRLTSHSVDLSLPLGQLMVLVRSLADRVVYEGGLRAL